MAVMGPRPVDRPANCTKDPTLTGGKAAVQSGQSPHCILLDARTLRRLYTDERQTTAQIACRVHCSPSTVRRQLIRFGIPARPRGPAPARVGAAPDSPFTGWSPEVAYVVGLLATDGNLGRERTTISIVSKDMDLLETVKRCDRVDAGQEPHARPARGPRRLLRRLFSWVHRRMSGSVRMETQRGKHSMWKLRYAKADSLRLLAWMYYSSVVPCLQRKRRTAERFLRPLGHAAMRSTGRPRVGWIYDIPTTRRTVRG